MREKVGPVMPGPPIARGLPPWLRRVDGGGLQQGTPRFPALPLTFFPRREKLCFSPDVRGGLNCLALASSGQLQSTLSPCTSERRKAMSSTGSISRWLNRLQDGDRAAVQKLWEGYF